MINVGKTMSQKLPMTGNGLYIPPMVIWGMVCGIASPTLMYMAPKEKGDDHLHFMAKQFACFDHEKHMLYGTFFDGISHVILPFPKGHPSTNRILRYFDDFSPSAASPSTKITKSSEKHKKKWRTTGTCQDGCNGEQHSTQILASNQDGPGPVVCATGIPSWIHDNPHYNAHICVSIIPAELRMNKDFEQCSNEFTSKQSTKKGVVAKNHSTRDKMVKQQRRRRLANKTGR